MEYRIRRYSSEDREIWDAFVRGSRNATFLFERGYMDYHADRFDDCSWMVFKGERLVALLPANLDEEGVLHSHQGLTYGGWLLPQAHLDGADLLEIFSQAIHRWRDEGIKALDYKPLPWIYAARPSEEDLYALFRLGAEATELNLSSTIDLTQSLLYNKLRKRTLKKASEIPFTIEEVEDAGEFMALVDGCLQDRHDAKAVHSAAEMRLLQERFPENIRMFGIRLHDALEAGVMIYETERVAHAQYIASTALGRGLNLLTPLFDYLIRTRYASKRYFDFGISNEDHGRYLNEGLLRQKFSYGATGTAYQRFYLDF